MNEPQLTPAAIGALARCDLENFAVAATPGGIKAQEKRGQIEQSVLDTLPIDGTKDCRAEWEKLGFVFGESHNKLFVNVKFPKGWTKKVTDHDMWTKVLDDKGRPRAMIFYKAAFYDLSAKVHFVGRFSVERDWDDKVITVSVVDASKQIDKKITGLKVPDWSLEGAAKKEAKERYDAIEAACKTLEAWLTEGYPNWKDVSAYWE